MGENDLLFSRIIEANTSLNKRGVAFIKRMIDIVIATIMLIVFSPIMLLAALAIKIDSPGPILFAKEDDGSPLCRVGKGGKLFHYFKFRSMIKNTNEMRYGSLAHLDCHKDEPIAKIKDDPRITSVGKIIRRLSIDELPELFLVLKGDMSLVGPRPHFWKEVIQYKKCDRKCLAVKPGMTGLAQVSGRSDLAFKRARALDKYYLKNWSLCLDLIILLRTPLAVFKQREAL